MLIERMMRAVTNDRVTTGCMIVALCAAFGFELFPTSKNLVGALGIAAGLVAGGAYISRQAWRSKEKAVENFSRTDRYLDNLTEDEPDQTGDLPIEPTWFSRQIPRNLTFAEMQKRAKTKDKTSAIFGADKELPLLFPVSMRDVKISQEAFSEIFRTKLLENYLYRDIWSLSDAAFKEIAAPIRDYYIHSLITKGRSAQPSSVVSGSRDLAVVTIIDALIRYKILGDKRGGKTKEFPVWLEDKIAHLEFENINEEKRDKISIH